MKISFYFLCYLTLTSCSSNNQGVILKTSPYKIDLSSDFRSHSLINNIQGLKVISLETSEKSIISEAWGIQRILSVDNKFFILDNRYMSIKAFDSTEDFYIILAS